MSHYQLLVRLDLNVSLIYRHFIQALFQRGKKMPENVGILPEDIYQNVPVRISTAEMLAVIEAANRAQNETPEIGDPYAVTPPLTGQFTKKAKIEDTEKHLYRTPTPYPKPIKVEEPTDIPPSTALQVTPNLKPQAPPQIIDPVKRIAPLSL
jgi:hypothetical protein